MAMVKDDAPKHAVYMSRALQLAERGAMTVHPNPMVGCVLVKNEQVLAEGWHQCAGEAHAEAHALAMAKQHAHELRGATAYVSLEPCAHHGRTGPCCQALAAAGISRVVVAMRDPNPLVRGKGISFLRSQNIEVIEGVLEAQARELNRAFIKFMQQGLPFVQLKLAASFDGATAMDSGESQWISDAAAREDVQQLRAKVGAIVTGSSSFYRDNPSLTVRPNDWSHARYPAEVVRQPLRVVLSSRPPQPGVERTKIFNDGIASIWASCDADMYKAYPKHVQGLPLEAQGGRPDLEAFLWALAGRDINTVLVEAGAELAGAFVAAGLVDEFIFYYAAVLMGSNTRPMFKLPFTSMEQRLALQIKSVRQVGETVRITARFATSE